MHRRETRPMVHPTYTQRIKAAVCAGSVGVFLTFPNTWLPCGLVQSTTTSVHPSSIADLTPLES